MIKTIADVCRKVYSGGTPSRKHQEYFEQGTIPWLNTGEIAFNRIYKTENFITEAGLSNSSAKWVPANAVIVAMYGATAARTAIAKIPLTTNQACCNLIVDEEIADYRYVYYYICSQYTKLASLANGGAQQNLNAGQIKEYPMVLPDLLTQKRIADILSAIDDKIENNARINDNLQQQAYAYFLRLFVENEDPSWHVGTIADIGTVVGGGTPSKTKPEYYTEDGIAWITPKDLSIDKSKFIAHGENDISELGYRNSSATMMPAGTVLFSSRAPIGYIAIASNEVTTNQGFKSVVPHPEIGTPFVYYFLIHNLPLIESKASGSTFKEVSGSVMKSVEAVIPDGDTLAKFNDFCRPIFAMQEKLEQENRKLAEMRDSLLPLLMNGEIDVADIDA